MMKHPTPPDRLPLKERLRHVDRIVADLNVLLVVIAIGLATLDMTFFVSEKVIDNLPPITRVSSDAPPSSPN